MELGQAATFINLHHMCECLNDKGFGCSQLSPAHAFHFLRDIEPIEIGIVDPFSDCEPPQQGGLPLGPFQYV